MARAGIYKSEVLRARDKLLALGRYPSIDAVRTELGNTGSKATIHRYLKEIEEEEGATTGTKVAVSAALQDLVARLAERLHAEAEGRVAELVSRHTAEIEQYRAAQKIAQTEANELRRSLEQSQATLAEEKSSHRQTTERLREESLAHAQAAQQVADLQDRLQAEERHRQSLEEKQQHSRQALEHFRVSAKEQREQEQRQHEQQVQYLQGEVRSLNQTFTQKQQEEMLANQENARLTGELAKAEAGLHDARVELRGLKGVKEQLVSAQQQTESLGRRVIELEAEVGALHQNNADLETRVAEDSAQIQQLKIELASARTAAETQNQLAEKIQALMAEIPRGGKSGLKRSHLAKGR